jgi:3-dehydroquinate synthase
MDYLQQSFDIKFEYKVHFTSGLFDISNPVLKNFFTDHKIQGIDQKILFVVDQGVIDAHPDLIQGINNYFEAFPSVTAAGKVIAIPGGETAKNDVNFLLRIVDAVNEYGIDRHSYLAAIGGGSVIDLAGFAAAISHRGIKHIRIPTTVLSQNDSGVGVKNGINYKGKKNFLGSFSPPVAVFNDDQFLTTLSDRDWRSGISEAIKVALIKDAKFFVWLEEHALQLSNRDLEAMKYLIRRCADLHMEHIRSGDPFETGSSRPLDFGHWSAHKLEQLTNFEVFHGEAVAMGMALDSMYSGLIGNLSENDVNRIISLLLNVGFEITHPYMEIDKETSPIMLGLQEFREHLGGRLTITLLTAIGKGKEVHEIDWKLMKQAAGRLKRFDAVS